MTSWITTLNVNNDVHQISRCLAIDGCINGHCKDNGQTRDPSPILQWLARSLADYLGVLSIHEKWFVKFPCWSFLIWGAAGWVRTSWAFGIVTLLGDSRVCGADAAHRWRCNRVVEISGCGEGRNHRKPRVVLFTNPSARAGYDTRSIFKRSLTGFNSEFSFS